MDVIAVADTKRYCSHRVLRDAVTHLLSDTTSAEAILELTVECPPKDPLKWGETRNYQHQKCTLEHQTILTARNNNNKETAKSLLTYKANHRWTSHPIRQPNGIHRLTGLTHFPHNLHSLRHYVEAEHLASDVPPILFDKSSETIFQSYFGLKKMA